MSRMLELIASEQMRDRVAALIFAEADQRRSLGGGTAQKSVPALLGLAEEVLDLPARLAQPSSPIVLDARQDPRELVEGIILADRLRQAVSAKGWHHHPTEVRAVVLEAAAWIGATLGDRS